jgi:hypothetical protein
MPSDAEVDHDADDQNTYEGGGADNGADDGNPSEELSIAESNVRRRDPSAS